MKDILISVKRQKTEIKIFCACIVLAYVLNIISIVSFNTEWSELWTQTLWMAIVTCGLYGLSILLRLIFCCARQLLAKK